MKKLLAKFRRKEVSTPSRITNETVAEHRERMLAGGRRFKYPVQYARHRLVFNAIIISLVAAIIIIVIGWWQLYPAQNTSIFIYRVTRVLPLPVASVDGQSVPYSDYLMKYRGDVHYLEQKEQISLKSADGKRQVGYIKQQAMQEAIAKAYAAKLAKKLNISVSNVELESTLKSQRQLLDSSYSQQTQDATYLDFYGWSPDEYRHSVKGALLRQKVAYAIDDNAAKAAESIGTQLKADSSSLQAIAEAARATGDSKVTYGAPGWVPRINHDGGLATQANKLEQGKISGVIKSTAGDSYYFVRLLDKNDTQVNYEYIQIPLTTFTQELANIQKNGKVVQYISIPKTVGAK